VELLARLIDHCVDVIDVAAAGLMLVTPDGQLQVMAASSETIRAIEVFEAEIAEGPCIDCFRRGEPVLNSPLSDPLRWPRFSARATAAGFRSAHALPLRLRDKTIGALNMFHVGEGRMSDADGAAAQALADVATIAILQHRAARDAALLNQRLRDALNSRIVIEQAKGVVSEGAGVDMQQAFVRLRRHARNHNLLLADLAQAVSTKALPVSALDV
jgi:GAF domain-containing protein